MYGGPEGGGSLDFLSRPVSNGASASWEKTSVLFTMRGSPWQPFLDPKSIGELIGQEVNHSKQDLFELQEMEILETLKGDQNE